MRGMGRCTDGKSLHAWKSLNPYVENESQIAPDIQTVGKGLAGGYIPIADVLVSQKVANVLSSGSGTFMNGFTYQAHPLTCAAALESVQTIVKEDHLLARAVHLGESLFFREVAILLDFDRSDSESDSHLSDGDSIQPCRKPPAELVDTVLLGSYALLIRHLHVRFRFYGICCVSSRKQRDASVLEYCYNQSNPCPILGVVNRTQLYLYSRNLDGQKAGDANVSSSLPGK